MIGRSFPARLGKRAAVQRSLVTRPRLSAAARPQAAGTRKSSTCPRLRKERATGSRRTWAGLTRDACAPDPVPHAYVDECVCRALFELQVCTYKGLVAAAGVPHCGIIASAPLRCRCVFADRVCMHMFPAAQAGRKPGLPRHARHRSCLNALWARCCVCVHSLLLRMREKCERAAHPVLSARDTRLVGCATS